MAETIRLVDYYYVQVPQKAGEGAKVLRALKDAGVNLVAFSGFPAGRPLLGTRQANGYRHQ